LLHDSVNDCMHGSKGAVNAGVEKTACAHHLPPATASCAGANTFCSASAKGVKLGAVAYSNEAGPVISEVLQVKLLSWLQYAMFRWMPIAGAAACCIHDFDHDRRVRLANRPRLKVFPNCLFCQNAATALLLPRHRTNTPQAAKREQRVRHACHTIYVELNRTTPPGCHTCGRVVARDSTCQKCIRIQKGCKVDQ
jgi:hypothetical protein